MQFLVFNLEDEYDTVEAAYVTADPDGIAFHGSDDELVGWFRKDMIRGFHAVKGEA